MKTGLVPSTRPALPAGLTALAVAVSALFCPPPACAEPVTVDFESLASMTYWSGNPVPSATRLSTALLDSYGVVLSSESVNPYVAVVNLGVGHAPSGHNGIGGVGQPEIQRVLAGG